MAVDVGASLEHLGLDLTLPLALSTYRGDSWSGVGLVQHVCIAAPVLRWGYKKG